MENIEEIWKPVVGWEEFYEISNYGRIKALKRPIKRPNGHIYVYKERILKPTYNKMTGYLYIGLAKEKIKKVMSVHRLVATTYIPNPENKSQVNHKNSIKTDNRLENLEWMTSSENLKHSYREGTRGIGEKNKKATLTNKIVQEIREKYSKNRPIYAKIAEEYSTTIGIVAHILRNTTYKFI